MHPEARRIGGSWALYLAMHNLFDRHTARVLDRLQYFVGQAISAHTPAGRSELQAICDDVDALAETFERDCTLPGAPEGCARIAAQLRELSAATRASAQQAVECSHGLAPSAR